MTKATDTTTAPTPGTVAAGDDLRVIREQTRETLQIARALAVLLAPKEGEREGPTLENLLAVIAAQQRDILISIRGVQKRLNLVLDGESEDHAD